MTKLGKKIKHKLDLPLYREREYWEKYKQYNFRNERKFNLRKVQREQNEKKKCWPNNTNLPKMENTLYQMMTMANNNYIYYIVF